MSSPNDPLNFSSLAQAARSKDLKRARNILVIIGVITVLANGVFASKAKSDIDQEIDKQLAEARSQGKPVDTQHVDRIRVSNLRLAYLVHGGAAALGLTFVVLGFMVKSYPVPATVLGLILYLAGSAIFIYLNPATLVQGIVFKIIVIASLFASVQAALGYQRSLRTSGAAA